MFYSRVESYLFEPLSNGVETMASYIYCIDERLSAVAYTYVKDITRKQIKQTVLQ